VDREGGRGKRLLNREVKQGVGTRKVYSERKREGERWWAQEQQQIGAKKLLG